MDLVTPAAAPASTAGVPIRLSRLGDELLARYVARGSDRAFAVLYERYHQPLYRYCRSILRDDSDAQDALQSTFTGALAALRREQRSAPLRPWLFRIAHNEAISLIRRRGRNAMTNHGSTEPLGAASSAEHEVAERPSSTSLVEDLGRLPDRQRAA
jgi:RNA polymerase sigma factor (sigma-70 family)